MSGRRPFPGSDEESLEEEEPDELWANENVLKDWELRPGIPDGDVVGEICLGCEPCLLLELMELDHRNVNENSFLFGGHATRAATSLWLMSILNSG